MTVIEYDDMIAYITGDQDDGAKLDVVLQYIRGRRKTNADSLIALCGKEGRGKSTLAIQVSMAVDDSFSVDQICMTGQEYVSVGSRIRDKAIILDEGISALYKRKAMSKQNTAFSEFLFINRENNLSQFVCFPSPRWLDGPVGDHRAELMFFIKARGICTVHWPKRSDFGGSTFWQPAFSFRFPDGRGPIFEAYRAKKRAMVRGHAHADDDFEYLMLRAQENMAGLIPRLLKWTPEQMRSPRGGRPSRKERLAQQEFAPPAPVQNEA